MFKINEIRATTETTKFLSALRDVLKEHNVTMTYGQNHIEFSRPDAANFAQCYCVNGGTSIK